MLEFYEVLSNPIALGIYIALAIGGSIYLSISRQLKRQKELQVMADSLGFSYNDEQTEKVTELLESSSMLGNEMFFNVLGGTFNGTYFAIGDFNITVGSDSRKRKQYQTYVVIHSGKLTSPNFCLQPECALFRMAEGLLNRLTGSVDIDFPTHPEFSDNYFLKGSDEVAVRNFFTPRVLEYFQTNHGLSVEVFNGTLVFFRLGELVKPDDIKTLIDNAMEVHQVLLPQ
jgi:hypothetical protein